MPVCAVYKNLAICCCGCRGCALFHGYCSVNVNTLIGRIHTEAHLWGMDYKIVRLAYSSYLKMGCHCFASLSWVACIQISYFASIAGRTVSESPVYYTLNIDLNPKIVSCLEIVGNQRANVLWTTILEIKCWLTVYIPELPYALTTNLRCVHSHRDRLSSC